MIMGNRKSELDIGGERGKVYEERAGEPRRSGGQRAECNAEVLNLFVGEDMMADEDIKIIDDDAWLDAAPESAEELSDEIDGLGEELEDLADRSASGSGYAIHKSARMAWLARRIVDCALALDAFRPSRAKPWPKERVPERIWRELGDAALGISSSKAADEATDGGCAGHGRRGRPGGLAAERRLDRDRERLQEREQERLIQERPAGERAGLRRLFNAGRNIRIFQGCFEAERAAWERAYWMRATDEAFGKRPWTGPSGADGVAQ
jgi:hypothetical protein